MENRVWCRFRTRGELTALMRDILPTSQHIPLIFLVNTMLWSSYYSLIPIQSSTLLEQVEVKSHVRAAYYSDASLCFSHKLCSSHMVVKDTAGPFETTQMKFKSSRLWTSPGIKQWTTHYGPDFNWFHNYAKHSERHRELQLTVKCAFLISQAAALLSTDYIQLFQHYFSYCRWEEWSSPTNYLLLFQN